MAEWDPATWSRLTLALYGLGALYLLGFLGFFGLLLHAGNAARSGGPAAVARYNRLLRGFPNAFYAKMLGRKPLVAGPPQPKSPPPPHE